jgi:hypothetical protein
MMQLTGVKKAWLYPFYSNAIRSATLGEIFAEY